MLSVDRLDNFVRAMSDFLEQMTEVLADSVMSVQRDMAPSDKAKMRTRCSKIVESIDLRERVKTILGQMQLKVRATQMMSDDTEPALELPNDLVDLEVDMKAVSRDRVVSDPLVISGKHQRRNVQP